jgi:hypothetical protein
LENNIFQRNLRIVTEIRDYEILSEIFSVAGGIEKKPVRMSLPAERIVLHKKTNNEA